MSISIKLRSVEKRLPWSFLGFLLGLFFGIFGLYSVFFYSRTPDMRIEILSSVPVLSIRENLPDLDIIFKGRNIRQSQQSLTLVNLKIVNRGNVAIKPGDFDLKDPLAIRLQDGEIVKSYILETSELYLDKVFSETISTSRGITFPPFIMEPGHYISLRMLVLHSQSVKPSFKINGKIANVPLISITDSSETGVSPGRSTVAFGGDTFVQFIRIASYGLGTVIFLIGSLWLTMSVKDVIYKRKREQTMFLIKKRLADLRTILSPEMNNALEPIAKAVDSDRYFILNILLTEIADELDPQIITSKLKKFIPDLNRDYFLQSEERMQQLRTVLQLFKEIKL